MINEFPPNDPFRKAYDPETFRTRGHKLVDRLADYLASTLAGEGKVSESRDPLKMEDLWKTDLDVAADKPGELLTRFMETAMHVHHPRFVGHQNAVPLPLSALSELMTSLLNNSNAIYEMGPSGTLIEREVVQWMRKTVGMSDEADGIFTSGGTLGNLTALLAARQIKAGGNPWREGTPGKPVILVSDQSHYSVARAVGIMGWGESGLEKIPVDSTYRMRLDLLEEARTRLESQGRKVIAVVATAGSTSTGAYDPLDRIADFAERHDIWMHVDGAHGAAAALSPRYRGLVRGMERADSLIWDGHKMLMTPSLTTVVLFKRQRDSLQTFAQEASFLFQKSAREEWYNLCHRTLECTKRDYTFRLYLALKTYGSAFFADYVTRTFDLARSFADLIRNAKDFELGAEPQNNIVCFRFREGADRQTQLRNAILARGNFYLTQTTLPTGVFLRTTLMNPFTTINDLAALLDEVREVAKS